MNRPVHFEIHAEDLKRASEFYTKLFGRKFTARENSDTEYMMIETGSEGVGINGGLVKRMGPNPEPMTAVKGYVCTIDVESVDEALEKAVSLGSVVALEKQAIPGVGRLAYLIDTEKNIFGIMHSDPTAVVPTA